MTIGIFPNLNKTSVQNSIGEILQHLEKNNVDFILHSPANENKIKKEAQILLILGGDGTFLKAFSIYKNSLPFLGINFGKFGFLSYSELTDLENLIEELKKGNFKIDKRSFLKIDVTEETTSKEYFALNEATLIRDISARLIEIPIYIDDIKIGPVPCDGIIVSTPTGSTAYNLSAGGPILHPHQESMVVSFMLSHSLFSRSLVLGKESNIEIDMKAWNDGVFLIIDGRIKIELNSSSLIKISIAKDNLKFVETKNYNFIKILERKFGWGKRAL